MDLASLRLRIPRVPIAIQFTREGWIFVLLCLAIGAAAVNTGNNVLYFIFSLMLGLIVVSGMISRRMLVGLSAQIDFPKHIFSGVRNVCYISLTNGKKRLPSIGIRFVSGGNTFPQVSRHFFHIPSGSTVHGFAPVLFSNRGIYELREMELHTRFPFSFFVKIRRFFVHQQIKVYPRIYRLSEELLARYTEGMMMSSPYRGESQQLLHLRDYTSNDSSKKIHWKASAKIEKLLVKEYQREQGRDLHLYFDCYPEKKDPDSLLILEKAISFLASVAFYFAEKGIMAGIHFRDRSLFISSVSASMIPLLTYLAEFGKSTLEHESWRQPVERNALVLQLRSKRIPPRFSMQSGGSRVLFVEDWLHLLKDQVASL